MEGLKILRRPKLRDPYLICAWPGMGEVAFKAAQYLIDKLKAEEFAQIPPGDFFYLTGNVIEGGVLSLPELPYSKFYFWKNKAGKNDLIIFISNSQPDLSKASDYCDKIIGLAKFLKVKTVIGFAAMPQPIEHTQEPGVWFTATTGKINESLKKFNLQPMYEGQISGMNGLFLAIAKKKGLDGFCLLGEIPLYAVQIENPKSSSALLRSLSSILGMQIDLAGLKEQADIIDAEINKLLEYLKAGSQSQSAPIGEDEIEKIKKALSQLTKLPASMKEKIEKLFEEAKLDINKANGLKLELDKWNVYKEYEDRFLDLFRERKKDKDN